MRHKLFNIRYNKVILVLVFLLFFFYLVFNSFNYLDNDFGWHLRVGQQILDEKAVPSAEYYNFTLEGKTWVDHEWLFDAIVYWIYDSCGYITLTIFFALLMLSVLVILFVFTHKSLGEDEKPKEYKQTWVYLAFLFLGLLAASPHIGIRMQEIALLNILLELIIIWKFDQKKEIKYLFFLLPLFIFWANIHGSFLIGLFVLCFWLGVKVLEFLFLKYKLFEYFDYSQKASPKDLPRIFFFIVLSFLVTLLTPYKLRLYLFLKDYADNYYTRAIAEWLPAFSYPVQYTQLIYAAFFAAILVVYMISFVQIWKKSKEKAQKLSLWELLLPLFFFALAFKSKRHFPLFFVVSFPLMIKLHVRHYSIPDNFLKFLRNNLFIKSYLVIALIMLIVSYFFRTNFTNDPFQNKQYCNDYPCTAIEFLKSDNKYQDLRIFNNYGWGGFLLWTWPEKKIFIDGRLPQYKLGASTFLEEYNMFFAEEGYKKLDEYDIDVVFLKPKGELKLDWLEKFLFSINEEDLNKPCLLREYLDESQEWSIVYNDKLARIYERIQ